MTVEHELEDQQSACAINNTCLGETGLSDLTSYTTIPLIFYLIFLLVIVTGCIIFITTVAKNKNFHVARWYLLANLSFCDILFSVVVVSFEVGRLVMASMPEKYENFCRVKATAYGTTFVSSMLSVAMALCEHFLAITFPIFYKLHGSISNTLMMVFLSWLFSICFTVAAEILLFDPFTNPVEAICVNEVKFCPTFINIVWASFSVVSVSTVITYLGCLIVHRKKCAKITPDVLPLPDVSVATGRPATPSEDSNVQSSDDLHPSRNERNRGSIVRKESVLDGSIASDPIDASYADVVVVPVEEVPFIQRRKALDEATLALGMVAASHLVVWLTIGILFYMTSWQVEKETNVARNFIILMSCSVHPLVYYRRVKEFQKAVKRLLLPGRQPH